MTAKYIFGLVLFTGKQTKLMKNMIKPRLKRTKMDKVGVVREVFSLSDDCEETQPHDYSRVHHPLCRVHAGRHRAGRVG